MINFKRLEEISLALKSEKQTGRSFHTTFVYNGSKMLCIATNDYTRYHPYHKMGHYVSTRTPGQIYEASLHSEIKALIRLGLEDCSHLTFVNIRIDNDNLPAISRACPNCYNILREIGFKKFYYFDGEKYKLEK